MKSQTAAPSLQTILDRLRSNIAQIIRGKDEKIDQVLVCLAAGGHVLIEDLPGLGKTTLAYCLARSIDCSFSRIQFTSDLLPADVVGVSVYEDSKRAFEFKKGPIFSSIVLADEINRATPKTQSALLEVMDRGKVSVDGDTHDVGTPFMVFATQNPVDFEGTFPLPESQMDRFMMRLSMGYADFQHEKQILSRSTGHRTYDSLAIEPIATAEDIRQLTESVPNVFIEDSVIEYLLNLVTATRSEAEFQTGISTRGALSLKAASQAYALLNGRSFVMPQDIAAVTKSVFTHRITLARHSADPLEERRLIERLINRIIDSIRQPV